MSYLNPSPIVIGDRTDFPEKALAADSERLRFCRVNLGTFSVKML